MTEDALPRELETHSNVRIFTYFGALIFLVALASPIGYLGDISTSYMLKNQLAASASQVADFRIYTAIPVYFAFVFGFVRDRWSPLGSRDRGYLIIFGPLTAIVYVWLGWQQLTMTTLIIGMLVVMLSFRFVGAAYQALLSLIGAEKLMSGRLVTVWQIVASIPTVASAFASGWAATHLDPSSTFYLLAAFALAIGLIGFAKPKAVFANAYNAPQAIHADLVTDLKRLFKHKAIYPAILVNFLWNFAPGASTPLQYYLSNTLHASDEIYANFNAIFAASFIPTFFLYGFLCRRVVLRKLLIWGTVVAVPQMIPLALVHSAQSAMWLAAPIGLMGGVATASYYDLAVRSCPAGLQGTLMMAVEAVVYFSARTSDKLGALIYDADPEHGFLYCVITITLVYACILPVVLLVPKHIAATADGEIGPVVEAAELREGAAATEGLR